MRRIPAGTFKMGSPASEETRDTDDRLQTDVTLTRPYYVGVFEVTENQWNRINNGSTSGGSVAKGGDSYNVLRGTGRNWPTDRTVDPNSWIAKLRTKTGIPFDLPTEAQWEKAARAGTVGVYYDGTVQPDTSKLNALAWTGHQEASADRVPHSVGLLKPNNYGLYDVLGNMAEKVLDWYVNPAPGETVDPVGPVSGSNRIYKGAGYNFTGEQVRLAARSPCGEGSTSANWGFRLAMPAQW